MFELPPPLTADSSVHRRKSESKDVVAISCPSGEKQADVTASRCPSKVLRAMVQSILLNFLTVCDVLGFLF